MYSDSYIIALAVYQKLYKIKYAQAMLTLLASLEVDAPSASTFCERKQPLLGQIILAVKQLCAQQQRQAVEQHLDSKQLAVIDFARANRETCSAYGDIHKRLHLLWFSDCTHALMNKASSVLSC